MTNEPMERYLKTLGECRGIDDDGPPLDWGDMYGLNDSAGAIPFLFFGGLALLLVMVWVVVSIYCG